MPAYVLYGVKYIDPAPSHPAPFQAKKNDDTKTKKKVWSPHGYLGMSESWDHLVYTVFWCSLFPLVWYASTTPVSDVRVAVPLALHPRLPGSRHHAVCTGRVGVDLIKLPATPPRGRAPPNKVGDPGVTRASLRCAHVNYTEGFSCRPMLCMV